MSAVQSPSLLSDIRALDRQLIDLSCLACGGNEPSPVWRSDRYLWRVELPSCGACCLIYLARGLRGNVEAQFYQRFYPRLMKQPPAQADLWQYRLIAGYSYSCIKATVGDVESVRPSLHCVLRRTPGRRQVLPGVSWVFAVPDFSMGLSLGNCRQCG